MQISGPVHLHGAQGVNAPHSKHPAQTQQPTQTTPLKSDELELSEAAQIAAKLSEVSDVRQDRVATIRQAIADGTYETQDKLSTALDKLLDELG